MSRRGFSLIDLILAIGIIAVLFGGIFLVYFSIVDTAVNYELRRAASNVLNQKVELVRNLSYEQVGVIGGIPSGILEQSEQVSWDGAEFIVQTAVRNVDDPFDGTAGGSPGDTAPADYKLVEFSVTCPTCPRFTPVSITTTVAPQGLESASQNGSLFISVFDANGQPVPSAEVTITNSAVSPAINFSDITGINGLLQLVDVPTSTQAYHVTVTKAGYSSEGTYPVGAPGNPNPVKPHATVGSQAVTVLSFAIDRVGSVEVASSGYRCEAVASQPFTLAGTKLVGTAPDVLKYTFSGSTAAGGETTVSGVEWDAYTATYTGSMDLAGMVPLSPFALAPDEDQPFRFVLAPSGAPSLLVTAVDAVTGSPVAASFTLNGPGASDPAGVAGAAVHAESDWSNPASYASLSGTETSSGEIRMSPAGGPYATSSVATLESATLDLGGTPAGATFFDWDASGSVRFQVAGSDDGGSWSFVGPDGSGSSYFTSPAAVAGSAAGKRYVRYRAYLETADEFTTPAVSEVRLTFAGPCVPPGQRLFQNLAAGSYTVDAAAGGYSAASATTTVGSGWQSVTVSMSPS